MPPSCCSGVENGASVSLVEKIVEEELLHWPE